jgi:hypothetical protein
MDLPASGEGSEAGSVTKVGSHGLLKMRKFAQLSLSVLNKVT